MYLFALQINLVAGKIFEKHDEIFELSTQETEAKLSQRNFRNYRCELKSI